MKKTLWLALVLLFICVFTFSACDSGDIPQTPNDTPSDTTDNTTESETDAHIHTFGEWITIKDATCTVKGEQERSCSCGEKENQSIDATGHTEVIDAAVAATCTTDGKTEGKHCSVCSETLIAQNNIPASHTAGEWVVDTTATCTVDGSKHQVCSVCTVTIKTEPIAATGHDYSETLTSRDCAHPAKINYACSQCPYTYEKLVNSPKLVLEHKGTSSATMNGYGRFSFSYTVAANDGYGKILYKYELFASSTATVPATTIDFTEETSVSVSYTGYEDTINEYIYKISAKDEAGNLSIYWFKLEDCSVIKSEDASAIEHSYENKTCVCGRDVTADTIATYDLSQNQDGSIIAYLTSTSNGKKLYILGKGEMKNYSNITSAGHTLTPFKNTDDIKEVYFSNQITSIGSYLFYFCQGITAIEIPDSVKTIGNNAFVGCTNIKTLVLHEGLVSIGNEAFDNTGIKELHLPASVKYIGEDAFSSTNLEGELIIPSNVEFLGKGFAGYTNISILTVESNNRIYHSNGNCIIETATKTIVAGCKNSIIPNDGSVECVGEYAFAGCAFTEITIPNTITSIGSYAFSWYTLEKVYIPNSVVQIGRCAFYGHTNLIIRCESSNKPNDWDEDWNKVDAYPDKYANIVWGYIE